jgi:hypothetical protein
MSEGSPDTSGSLLFTGEIAAGFGFESPLA